MQSRSAIITTGIILTGCFVVWGQKSDLSGTLNPLKDTLRDLQDEVRSLQKTIKQLSREAQKNRAKLPLPPPFSAIPQAPDLEKAGENYFAARRLEDQKLYAQAADLYARAIFFDPQRDASFLHRGYCYYHLGENASAISDLLQSIALQPENSRAYLALARAYAASGQASQAMLEASVVRQAE